MGITTNTHEGLKNTTGDLNIINNASDGDVIIKGNDGGSVITALTLDMSDSGKATFLGEVIATEYNLPSGGMLDWANGDARITEGLVNNYSLSFQTWDGSAISTALRLDGDNTATFAGTIGSGAITSTGAVEGTSFVKTGGASTGFLKADGSVDSNTYVTGAHATDFVSATSGGTFSGNVTLESASPVLKIDATSTGYPEILFTRLTGDDQSARIKLHANQLRFENEGDPDSTFLFQGRAAGASSLSDYLLIEDTGTTVTGELVATSLDINGNADISGNVGIGTSSPIAPLHIATTNTDTDNGLGALTNPRAGILINNLSTAANTYAALDFRAGTHDARIALTNGGSNIGNMNFIVDNGNSPIVGMALTSVGNVTVAGTIGSGAITSTGAVEGASFVKTGGTSSQFLKADGTVDANTYVTGAHATDFVSAASGGTFSGAVGVGVAGGSNAKLEVVATSGEVFRADANNGAYRIIADQTGVNLQGSLDVNGDADISGNLDLGSISTTSSGTIVNGGFANPAAEDGQFHLPQVHNDLAGFQHWGATVTVSGFYKTRTGSAAGNDFAYSNAVVASDFDNGHVFDSNSSTAGSWYTHNGTDGTTQGVGTIELDLDGEEFTYSTWAGIVFGNSSSFHAPCVKIETYSNGAWQTLCDVTDNSDVAVLRRVNGSFSNGNGTTKIKYTLSSSITGNFSYLRIHTLYAAYYKQGELNSQHPGLNFLNRYKSNHLYGSLYPGADTTYDLGSSSVQWRNLYVDGYIDMGSNQFTDADVGNWDTAYGWGNHASTYLPLAGGTMSGAIAMGSQNITGGGTITGTTLTCADLTIGSDATTAIGKSYLKLGDVSVASYTRINADETVSLLSAAQMLSAIGGGTSSLVLVDEDNMSSDSATLVPSQQSVKAYVDGAVIANTDTQDLSIVGQTLSLTNSPDVTLPTQTTVTGSSGSCTGLASQATNLNATDDRDMAPEDYAYSDDFRVFFSSKEGLEDGSTIGTNYQDVLYIDSYTDSSGGDANVLAFDKSEKAIYHYQADQDAANWGTAKQLAYTDSAMTGNTSGTAAGLSTTLAVASGGTGLTDISTLLNVNVTLNSLGAAAASHTHAASDVISGTFATARIPSLATSKITSGTFANGRISEASVTQHETALTITESQISDLGTSSVTTANVTAAGALMDSEVDANIQTFALPANTTISAYGASLVDDADAAAARGTLGLGAAALKGVDTGYPTSTSSNLVTASGIYDYFSDGAAVIDLANSEGLGVAGGGTGLSTVGTNQILTGNGTGSLTSEANLTFNGSELSITGTINSSSNIYSDGHITCDGDMAPQGGVYTNSIEVANIQCPTGGNLAIRSAGNMAFTIDADGDETGQTYKWYNHTSSPTTLMTLNEAGQLSCAGLTLSGDALAITSGGTGEMNSNDWLNSRVIISQSGNLSYGGGTTNQVHHDQIAGYSPSLHFSQSAITTTGTVTTGTWNSAMGSVALGNINETGTVTTGLWDSHRKFSTATGSGHDNVDILHAGPTTTGMTAGLIYQLKATEWVLAQADSEANCKGLLAIALATTDADGFAVRGSLTMSYPIVGTETYGDVLYLSETTAGRATTTAPSDSGEIVRIIGYALKDNDEERVWFDPDKTYIEIV